MKVRDVIYMSQPAIIITEQPELVQRADFYRVDANLKLNRKTRSKMGQFMTPSAVAEFMASLFLKRRSKEITLLDPGAGVGSLTSAFIGNIQRWDERPSRIAVDVYELEPVMHDYLDSRSYERVYEVVGATRIGSINRPRGGFQVAPGYFPGAAYECAPPDLSHSFYGQFCRMA